jgi:hypothetical protein
VLKSKRLSSSKKGKIYKIYSWNDYTKKYIHKFHISKIDPIEAIEPIMVRKKKEK